MATRVIYKKIKPFTHGNLKVAKLLIEVASSKRFFAVYTGIKALEPSSYLKKRDLLTAFLLPKIIKAKAKKGNYDISVIRVSRETH